jgi:hypothetical protein
VRRDGERQHRHDERESDRQHERIGHDPFEEVDEGSNKAASVGRRRGGGGMGVSFHACGLVACGDSLATARRVHVVPSQEGGLPVLVYLMFEIRTSFRLSNRAMFAACVVDVKIVTP